MNVYVHLDMYNDKKHVEFAPCDTKPSQYLIFRRYFFSGVDLNVFGSFGNPCSKIGGASDLSGLTSHTFDWDDIDQAVLQMVLT